MNSDTTGTDHIMRHTGSRKEPLSERVCDFVCIGFALWTVCCHIVVALGGALHCLLTTFATAVVIVTATVLLLRRWRKSVNRQSPYADPPVQSDAPEAKGTNRPMVVIRAIGILAAAGTLLVYVKTHQALLLWWGSVFVLLLPTLVGLLTRRLCRDTSVMERAARRHRLSEGALLVVGLGCVALALVSHRSDPDDAFYVNVAVTACDQPDRPLMLDGMHGIEGLRLHMPAHRVHALDLFNAAVSYLTGVQAIYVCHWVTASLAACLVPLAFASLFRILTPRFWLWSVVAVLVVLVGAGDTHRWYGNFALVRIWQGKSVYLSVLLPLAYAYGLRFGAAPTSRHWLLLSAVQIAAVGCTSSALWSVPMATFLATCSAVRPGRGAVRTLTFALLASAYVVAVGVTLKGAMGPTADRVRPVMENGTQLATALVTVLGHGKLKYFAVGSMLVCWALCRKGPAFRFAALVPLVVLLTVLNPYAEELVSRNLTGPSHWRAMWAMPVPILIALLLTAPFQIRGRRLAGIGGGTLAAVAMATFLFAVPRITTLGERNETFVERPRPKVHSEHYLWAQRLLDNVPPGSFVVAPQQVGLWLPTFHHHPYPLVVRERYLRRVEAKFGAEGVQYRLLMTEVVSGKDDVERHTVESEGFQRRAENVQAVTLFRDGLDHFDIKGVCLSTSATHVQGVQAALASSGFVRTITGQRYEIWVRL